MTVFWFSHFFFRIPTWSTLVTSNINSMVSSQIKKHSSLLTIIKIIREFSEIKLSHMHIFRRGKKILYKRQIVNKTMKTSSFSLSLLVASLAYHVYYQLAEKWQARNLHYCYLQYQLRLFFPGFLFCKQPVSSHFHLPFFLIWDVCKLYRNQFFLSFFVCRGKVQDNRQDNSRAGISSQASRFNIGKRRQLHVKASSITREVQRGSPSSSRTKQESRFSVLFLPKDQQG